MALEILGQVSSRNPFVVFSDIPTLVRELTKFGRANAVLANVNNRAMNSAIRPAKTAAKRAISRKRNLPLKRVDSRLRIVFSTPSRLRASIWANGAMIPLTALKGGTSNPRQQSRGVKVTATVGKRTLIPEAFIAKGRARPGIQVFQRTRVGGGPRREGRLPIQALTVPSVPHTLVEPDIAEAVVDRYNVAWVGAYRKQLTNTIRRVNRKVMG